MSQSRKRWTVGYADQALRELDAIADWNEQTYNRAHAKAYVRFLLRQIERLETDFEKSRPVSTRPDLRYILIQKRSKGYGHVAVFTYDHQAITIVHVFHTAQDWENKLTE